MTLSNKLRSLGVRLICSDRMLAATRALAEIRRRIARRPHQVFAFVELDDPYSYLLTHYLPQLAEAYEVELHYCLAESNYDRAYRPQVDMLAAHAEQDCARLAAELGVPFLDRGNAPPVEHRRTLIEMLAMQIGSADFERELRSSFALYWRGDAEGIARRVAGIELAGRGQTLVAGNGRRLRALGHYNCATLYYGAEWYWGIDRLHYLLARLDELGVRRVGTTTAQLTSIRQVMQTTLPVAKPAAAKSLPPLDYFYSFRSPYSWLSLQRVFDLCDAFGLQLDVRPVLPMVMRGMRVPGRKLAYIARDTTREARRLGVPYGNFADPIGVGVERCMAVYQYARTEKRERDFLLRVGNAIWAGGIDVATDDGMRRVTERCGLFWPGVVEAMQRGDWREAAEANRQALLALGRWGVPTLRLGAFVVWGQDRIWMLARHLENQCETGEGILELV